MYFKVRNVGWRGFVIRAHEELFRALVILPGKTRNQRKIRW